MWRSDDDVACPRCGYRRMARKGSLCESCRSVDLKWPYEIDLSCAS